MLYYVKSLILWCNDAHPYLKRWQHSAAVEWEEMKSHNCMLHGYQGPQNSVSNIVLSL